MKGMRRTGNQRLRQNNLDAQRAGLEEWAKLEAKDIDEMGKQLGKHKRY